MTSELPGASPLPPSAFAMAAAHPNRVGPLTKQVGGSHYKDRAIQPVEFIHANELPFIEGSIVKYVSRWRDKNGVEDLLKARHYLDILIELEARASN